MEERVSVLVSGFLSLLKEFDLYFQVNAQGTFIFTDNETGKVLYITEESMQKYYEEIAKE